jgi:pimeloyl-ACP methyl ester carboxylesterase
VAQTIVFIHGAWLTPSAWGAFRTAFEQKGYETVAPAWPYLNRTVPQIRASLDPAFGKLGITEIADHYAKIVQAMPESPVLIGHSFGGLMVQLLLDRGLGAAGVAIDPAPVRGVLAGPLTLRNSLPVTGKLGFWSKIHTMSEKIFLRDFGNELPSAVQQEIFTNEIVPAPGRIFFQAALGIAAKVDFKNPKRPPLLVIGGEKDRTVEIGMIRATYKKQSRNPSPTEYLELPGRGHLVMAAPGWEQVVDSIDGWLGKVRS